MGAVWGGVGALGALYKYDFTYSTADWLSVVVFVLEFFFFLSKSFFACCAPFACLRLVDAFCCAQLMRFFVLLFFFFAVAVILLPGTSFFFLASFFFYSLLSLFCSDRYEALLSKIRGRFTRAQTEQQTGKVSRTNERLLTTIMRVHTGVLLHFLSTKMCVPLPDTAQ